MSKKSISDIDGKLDIYNSIRINDDNIELLKQIKHNEIFESIIKNMMNVFYPIGSIFISRVKYTLTDNKGPINTPLYYGKWVMINDTGVIGVADSNYNINDATSINTASYGDKKLTADHVPCHSHKGLKGYSHGFDKNNSMHVINGNSWNSNRGTSVRDNIFTGETIVKNVGWNDNINSYEVVNQINFNPYGYYFFTYKKISVD